MSPVDFAAFGIEAADRLRVPDNELGSARELVKHRRAITRLLGAERPPKFLACLLVKSHRHTAFAADDTNELLPIDQWMRGKAPRRCLDIVIFGQFALPPNGAIDGVTAEDALAYNEPPDWALPVRPYLGAALLAGATDLKQFVLALVLSSATGFVLVAYHRRSSPASEAAIKYYLLGAFTSASMLIGVAFLFGLAGATTLPSLADIPGPGSVTERAALVVEAQYGDFLDEKRVRGRWPVAHLGQVLAELSALHPRLPIVFAGNRKMANHWTARFFAACRAGDALPQLELVRETLVERFLSDWSASIQHQGYLMGEAVLDSVPEISEISLRLPNQHHLPFDLSRFGLEDHGVIFHPVSEPYGDIALRLTRN